MRHLSDSLKWILFIPLTAYMYIFGYILIRIIIASIVLFFFPSMPITENEGSNYEGHFIYATILALLKDSLPVGFAIFFGVNLVPKHKIKIFASFIAAWMFYVSLNLYTLGMYYSKISSIDIFLFIITTISQLISIIFAGYLLLKIEYFGWIRLLGIVHINPYNKIEEPL